MGIQLVKSLEEERDSSRRKSLVKSPIGDHLLRLRNSTPPRERNGFISPSGVMGCRQFAINQLRGEPTENRENPWMYPFFETANAIHRIYQELGVQAGALEEDSIEKWVEYPALRIGGSVDGLCVKDGPVCDFKTVNGRYFDMVKKKTTEPLHHYQKFQITCYMLATDRRESVFVYVNRDTPNQLHEVYYDFEEEIYQEISDWIHAVLAAYDKGTEFEEDFDWNNCQGCSYFNFNANKFEIIDGKKRIA